MDIQEATAAYEKWLGRSIRLVPEDLTFKHEQMAADEFSFFRATFYRWMQLWPEVCADVEDAPEVLACGDLHIENYGTWRDTEGRLVWGVNDFDEAYPLPYTQDLVRLATSSHLARPALARRDACEAILTGYRDALNGGGKPFLLAEHHVWLRDAAWNELRDPVHFWEKLKALKPWKGKVPADARKALDKTIPKNADKVVYLKRTSGLGSLGRERIVALTEWCGGLLAREAKSQTPSACVFAAGKKRDRQYYDDILQQSVRNQDPCLRVTKTWLFRRLSPDCCRIELSSLAKVRDQSKLLQAMGFEIGNVHLGTTKAIPKILKDLDRRPAHWLHEHSVAMTEAVQADWRRWGKKGKAAKAAKA